MNCPGLGLRGTATARKRYGTYEHLGRDILEEIAEETIGLEGMKIDRVFFDRFADTVREDQTIARAVEAGQWDRVIDYVNREVFDKPEEHYTLAKLRKAAAVDRRLTLREILEKIFDIIPRFKSKDELLEEEFAKFVSDHTPTRADSVAAIRPTSRRTPPTATPATSSTSGSSPGWPPLRFFPSATSGPYRRNTARSFPSM